MSEQPVESKIVTAVAISVNTTLGDEINKRIENAMADAVLECNAEGISTEEKNSWIIRERMLAAKQRVLDEINAAQVATQQVLDRR